MADGSLREYQIIKKIGKGSYGEVFLARRKKDRRQFVIKSIRLSNNCAKESHAATQEAELLSQLKHPNIVSYQESFQDDECVLHIVMGYCEGGDLCSRLKALRGHLLEEDKVVEWFIQITLAIQYLHDRKILHRDLKTQNIFLSKHDVIKVGDLGIARVLEGSLDFAHTIVGTPYYMSPELFANKPYDFKSDVWALGCCVYEIATLNHAFTAKNISALMYKILQGKVPPLPSCFSSELNRLVCEMLSLEAKARPSVHQILRNEFIRFHIKQFLDKASIKKRQAKQQSSSPSNNQHTSPTHNQHINQDSSHALQSPVSQPTHHQPKKEERQKKIRPLPEPPKPKASVDSSFLKPLQINELHVSKSSPELSLAREKRRRSKQEAREKGRVVIRSQSGVGQRSKGSPSSLAVRVDKGNDSEECDIGEDEEDDVLSVMDDTLRLPVKPSNPQYNTGACPSALGPCEENPQMTAIKRYCVAALGEDMVGKALQLLDTDYDNHIEAQMNALLGEDKCTEFLVLLQKMKLYANT